MSQLVDFYRGTATDREGRSLKSLWSWDDDRLEAVHDFIQWLFPLPEPSQFNADAPLLTPADLTAFHDDAALRANLRRSFERFMSFLGLSFAEDGQLIDGPNFAARALDVWAAPNHNWLRITRILRSLTLLGLADEARALYGWLEMAYRRHRFPIGADTFRYWTNAVQK
jgi:Opioid growth factor receptor (OGFr) conserved region